MPDPNLRSDQSFRSKSIMQVEQVGKFSHLDEVEMSKWSRKEHDLFNVDTDTLIGNGAQVNERHLNYYHYPKIQKLGKKVKGIYLN